jgi:hypothetical protein
MRLSLSDVSRTFTFLCPPTRPPHGDGYCSELRQQARGVNGWLCRGRMGHPKGVCSGCSCMIASAASPASTLLPVLTLRSNEFNSMDIWSCHDARPLGRASRAAVSPPPDGRRRRRRNYPPAVARASVVGLQLRVRFVPAALLAMLRTALALQCVSKARDSTGHVDRWLVLSPLLTAIAGVRLSPY